MAMMRPKLLKPYFFLDWDQDEQGNVTERIKVNAKKADIDRFRVGWPEVQERVLELDKRTDHDEADVEIVKETFRFLLGDEDGDALYRRCMAEVMGDEDLTEAECIYQLMPTMSYIADCWIEHVGAMSHQRSKNVEAYLQRANGGQPL